MKSITQITSRQISENGVQSLSDRPNTSAKYGVGGLSSSQLKLWFDRLAALLADKINEISSALSAADAADYIRIELGAHGMESLGDLIASINYGDFAGKLLWVYPSASEYVRKNLQAYVYDVTAALAELDALSESLGLTKADRSEVEAVLSYADSTYADLLAHLAHTGNPHAVTKEQVGLGNLSNDAQVKRSEMGTAFGVAELDEYGKVKSSQLPSFVDDVIEGTYIDAVTFLDGDGVRIDARSGKIYVDISSGITYRWSGSVYTLISPSLAIGETSSTAFAGDRGKAAYEHALSPHAPADAEANAIAGIKRNGVSIAPDAERVIDISVPEYPTVDTAVSEQSQNPVAGSAVKDYVDRRATVPVLIPVAGDHGELLTLLPNRTYGIDTLELPIEIALGEGDDGCADEWVFSISMGEKVYDIVLPSVRWGFGMAPSFPPDSVTVCRLYYVGDRLCGEWVTV